MVIVTSFQQPESPIIYEQSDTRAVLDKKDLGVGSLIISERTLCWKEPGGLGFSIGYTNVSMHAIAKDPTVYPTECIFVVIDGQLTMSGSENPQANVEDEDEEDDDDDLESITSHLILIPPDSNSIRTIYTALNQCQLLNPDPADVMDEDDNVYEDAEEYNGDDFSNDRLNDVAAGGDTDMNHLSAQLRNNSIHNTTGYSYGNGDQNFDDDQFEDAD